MPKKNKVTTTSGEQVDPENVVMDKDGFVKKTAGSMPDLQYPDRSDRLHELYPDIYACGHISKHHYNAKGRLEDIACDLPKGHAGDHHAVYMKLVDDPETDLRGITVAHHYREVEADTFWGDAAGTPVNQIKEGKSLQLSNFQKDILADIMKGDESLKVEDALAIAKASPKWMAANA